LQLSDEISRKNSIKIDFYYLQIMNWWKAFKNINLAEIKASNGRFPDVDMT
jgi:hypothetical protein